MGKKALIRLLIVLAVVCAAALIVKFSGSKIDTKADGGSDREKVFEDFPVNDVARIRVKTATEEVNLKKGEKTWEVAERGGHPAKGEDIVGFLRSVWDLKVVQAPEVGPSQFERLELIDPVKGPAEKSATVVSFQDAEGKELAALWLGKLLERTSGQPSPFGGPNTTEAGRFVKTGDADDVFLVSETFSDIETKPADWLSEDFFKVEKVRTIAIESKGTEKEPWTEADNWKLTREEETGDFTLVDAKATEELDNVKVSSMRNAFSSPKFEDVAFGKEAEENKPALDTFRVETFDGFTYSITTGEKNDLNEIYLTFSVDGKFEEKRKPGEEEDDEEKKRLDDEFAESLKKLQDKLATEKALAGKIFKARSYLVDTIRKKRSEILKEKEEIAPGVKDLPGVTSKPTAPPVPAPPGPADAGKGKGKGNEKGKAAEKGKGGDKGKGTSDEKGKGKGDSKGKGDAPDAASEKGKGDGKGEADAPGDKGKG